MADALIRIISGRQSRRPMSVIGVQTMVRIGRGERGIVAGVERITRLALALLVVVEGDSFPLAFGVRIGRVVGPGWRRVRTGRYAGVVCEGKKDGKNCKAEIWKVTKRKRS